MNKEIDVNGRKFVLRELLAIEVDNIDFSNHKEASKKQVMLSTNITEEQYNQLTWNERLQIFKAINELNGVNPNSPA